MSKFRWKSHFLGKSTRYLAYLLIICLCAPSSVLAATANADGRIMTGGGDGGAGDSGSIPGGPGGMAGGGGGGGAGTPVAQPGTAAGAGGDGAGAANSDGVGGAKGSPGTAAGPGSPAASGGNGGGGGGGAGAVYNTADEQAIETIGDHVTAGNGGAGDGTGGGGGGGVGLLDTGYGTVNIGDYNVKGGNGVGGGGGGAGAFSASGGALKNAGTITGGNGDGAGDGGAGVLSNHTAVSNTKIIKGGSSADGTGGAGAWLHYSSLINDTTGTITGGASTNGTGGAGVYITGGRGELTNLGTITSGNGGTAGIGVHMTGGGNTMTNSGTIELGTGTAPDAVVLLEGGGNTLINSKNITAGDNADKAVIFMGNNNILELQSGSTIKGIVDATDGTGNGFVLGGSTAGTFAMGAFGDAASTKQYRGFSTYSVQGGGTWTLSGTDDANISWDIEDGKLIGNTDIFKANQLVGADGTIEFKQSSGGTYTGVISGAGKLSVNNDTSAIALILTGDNTFIGGTTIEKGTLQIGDGNTGGSIADAGGVNIKSTDSILVFKRDANIRYGGKIEGLGALTKEGAGTLILTGDNTYEGDTTVATGTLQIGDGGASGSLKGDKKIDVKGGAILSFNRSGEVTQSGQIDGAGDIQQNGSGTLVLSADNSARTGNIDVHSGTVRLTTAKSAGATSDTKVMIATPGTLELTMDDTFENTIEGTGALLANAGTGKTVTLKGITTNYTGMTTVKSGTLKVADNTTFNTSSGLTLHKGAIFDANSSNSAIYAMGNKGLTVYGGEAKFLGDLDVKNKPVNLFATQDTDVDDPMLTVTGTADISGSQFNIDMSGATHLAAGTPFKMLTANAITGEAASGSKVRVGSTVEHDISLSADTPGTTLSGSVGAGRASRQAKALSEGFLGGMALAVQGADMAAGQGMDAAVSSAAGPTGANGMAGFGAVSGGVVRYNTGSYVDMTSISLLAGLSMGNDLPVGRLTMGTFVEYGNGSYDTYNSFSGAASVDGDGDTDYLGFGVLGRMSFQNTGPGSLYAEASARAGKLHNDYNSSDLRDGFGRKADYDSSSAYYGIHLGVGYDWQITEVSSIDLHGKYFWTKQDGDKLDLSTGERVKFDSVNSHRLRLGSRYAHVLNDYIRPYGGLAWEYEFDGEAEATTNGYAIDAPDMKGSTGIAELGLSIMPTASLPLTLDLGVQGYVGKREGVTGSLQFKLEF